MASPTKITRIVRKRKQNKSGRKRKNKLQNEGTTKSQEELFGDK